MDVVLNLPAGLKALALRELSFCAGELSNVVLDGAASATADILFDIESLIPQQWNGALVDHTCFPARSLDQCLRLIMLKARPRKAKDICQRVVNLMCHFLDGLPKANRHWTRLKKACSTGELRLFQGLLRLLQDCVRLPGVQSLYLTAALRGGLVTKAELKSPQAMQKFRNWYKLDHALEGMVSAFLWQQVQKSADS